MYVDIKIEELYSRWVASAAHCVSDSRPLIPANKVSVKQTKTLPRFVSNLCIQTVPPHLLQIVVGAHDYNSTDRGRTKTYAVDKIEVHRDRQDNPSWIDIALIRVQGSIDLKIHTPVCMPERNFDVRHQRNIVLTGE